MTEEEKKAIEFLKETCFDTLEYEEGLKSIEIVINLIQKQESEINKLKNVIDKMAERMNDLQYEIREDCFIPREYSDIDDCVKKESCKDCIKEYFMQERRGEYGKEDKNE